MSAAERFVFAMGIAAGIVIGGVVVLVILTVAQ